MLREDTFIVLYVSCFNAYCFIFMSYSLIFLYFVLSEIKNLFCLLVFSTYTFMRFV